MLVFRNLDCLSLVFCSNTTLLKLQTVLFLFFFQILRFEIGGAAYTRTFTVCIMTIFIQLLHVWMALLCSWLIAQVNFMTVFGENIPHMFPGTVEIVNSSTHCITYA